MKLGIAEILRKTSEIKDERERILYFRQHANHAVQIMVRHALDPDIIWELPPGAPPYKVNDLVDQQHRLYTEIRKLYLFIRGGNPNLKPLRREQLFIELLEVVDPEDAKLLLAAKDKTMPYSNITAEFINKAIPGFWSKGNQG